MSKRKSRNKLTKSNSVDLTKPIPLEKIGGNDDPCFGKLHDPTVHECQMCGDSEICSIIFAQNGHKKRLEVEKEKNFKDIQNLKPSWKDLSKSLLKHIKPGKSEMAAIIKGKICKDIGITEAVFDKLLNKLSEKTKKFKIDLKTNKITRL